MLDGKRILYLGFKTLITEEDELSLSLWATLRKRGVAKIYMILEACQENIRWANRLLEVGLVDDFNADGIVCEIGDGRPKEETVSAVLRWLDCKEIQVDAVFSVSDFLRVVQAMVSEKLGLPSDSLTSVENAFAKDVTQRLVLQSSNAYEFGVASYTIRQEDDLKSALEEQDFPVVMKPVSGCASSGCKLLFNYPECQRHLESLEHNMKVGSDVCQKFTQNTQVVLMEYLRGTKYSVDVVICKGQLAGGIVVKFGLAAPPSFAPTSASCPGDLSFACQQQLVTASYECCIAVGLQNGVYDVDMMWQDGKVPKLIEINPRPGGQGTRLAKVVYGVDLALTHALLCCGVVISKADFNSVPKGFADARICNVKQFRPALRRSYALMKSKQTSDILMMNIGRQHAAEHLEDTADIHWLTLLLIGAYDEKSNSAASEKLSKFLFETSFEKINNDTNDDKK